MPKATVTMKSGATIAIEGTQDEVAALVALIEAGEPAHRASTRRFNGKPGLSGLVSDLIEGGFFKEPRSLGDVKDALAERGHRYPVTSLSPLMVRLVRKRELRRLKEKKRWVYVD